MSYDKFLLTVFGSRYKSYVPIINSVNLYCIFIITIILSGCAYFLHYYKQDCENSFINRVKTLRLKSKYEY